MKKRWSNRIVEWNQRIPREYFGDCTDEEFEQMFEHYCHLVEERYPFAKQDIKEGEQTINLVMYDDGITSHVDNWNQNIYNSVLESI